MPSSPVSIDQPITGSRATAMARQPPHFSRNRPQRNALPSSSGCPNRGQPLTDRAAIKPPPIIQSAFGNGFFRSTFRLLSAESIQ
jgi:hypothetical protein